MRARIKAMRKVKDKVTECEEREDKERAAGVMKENFAELCLVSRRYLAPRRFPINVYRTMI